MMKIKALVEHANEYGDKHMKKVGDEYEAPDNHAKMLIAAKLVERVTHKGEAPVQD